MHIAKAVASQLHIAAFRNIKRSRNIVISVGEMHHRAVAREFSGLINNGLNSRCVRPRRHLKYPGMEVGLWGINRWSSQVFKIVKSDGLIPISGAVTAQ